MSLLDAVWLGIVQGLTEFLPVSSDGHLTLAHAFLGATSSEDLFFDLMLHLGTLIAVFAIFGRDFVRFAGEALRGLGTIGELGVSGALERSEGLRMVCLILVASVPTAIIGLLLKDSVESHAFSIPAVAIMIMINGVTLWSSQYAPKPRENEPPRPLSVAGIGFKEAVLIGIAQGLAVLPGISRSGSTIVTSLWLRAERERAAQFSFLLAIPAILGAFVLQLDRESVQHALQNPVPYVVGTLISAVVGVGALRLLVRLLREARFYRFAWYCWLLGLVALGAHALSQRS
jgi:undecaprenyl-diphosphatase